MHIRDGEALERDGYAVVRDVFSPEEIAWMRGEATALLAAEARHVNGGLVNGPVPRDSDLARRLLDDARLAFPSGDDLPCELHIHANTFNYWHADGKPLDRSAMSSGAPAWMYKIVIYLQDHPNRGGFSVVPGSHRQGNSPRAALHVGTSAGDIVFFDHCVWHAGQLPNRLLGEFAWLQHRLGLIGEKGCHVFRLQHLLQPAPDNQRLAIFVLFTPHQDIGQRYAALTAA